MALLSSHVITQESRERENEKREMRESKGETHSIFILKKLAKGISSLHTQTHTPVRQLQSIQHKIACNRLQYQAMSVPLVNEQNEMAHTHTHTKYFPIHIAISLSL